MEYKAVHYSKANPKMKALIEERAKQTGIDANNAVAYLTVDDNGGIQGLDQGLDAIKVEEAPGKAWSGTTQALGHAGPGLIAAPVGVFAGSMATAAALPVTGPAAPVVGFGAGLGAAAVTESKLFNALKPHLPEWLQKDMALGEAANPKSAMVGGALSTLGPQRQILAGAGKALFKNPAAIKEAGGLGKFLMQTEGATAKEIGINLGAGAGVGAGIEGANQIRNKEFDPTRLGLSTVLAAGAGGGRLRGGLNNASTLGTRLGERISGRLGASAPTTKVDPKDLESADAKWMRLYEVALKDPKDPQLADLDIARLMDVGKRIKDEQKAKADQEETKALQEAAKNYTPENREMAVAAVRGGVTSDLPGFLPVHQKALRLLEPIAAKADEAKTRSMVDTVMDAADPDAAARLILRDEGMPIVESALGKERAARDAAVAKANANAAGKTDTEISAAGPSIKPTRVEDSSVLRDTPSAEKSAENMGLASEEVAATKSKAEGEAKPKLTPIEEARAKVRPALDENFKKFLIKQRDGTPKDIINLYHVDPEFKAEMDAAYAKAANDAVNTLVKGKATSNEVLGKAEEGTKTTAGKTEEPPVKSLEQIATEKGVLTTAATKGAVPVPKPEPIVKPKVEVKPDPKAEAKAKSEAAVSADKMGVTIDDLVDLGEMSSRTAADFKSKLLAAKNKDELQTIVDELGRYRQSPVNLAKEIKKIAEEMESTLTKMQTNKEVDPDTADMWGKQIDEMKSQQDVLDMRELIASFRQGVAETVSSAAPSVKSKADLNAAKLGIGKSAYYKGVKEGKIDGETGEYIAGVAKPNSKNVDKLPQVTELTDSDATVIQKVISSKLSAATKNNPHLSQRIVDEQGDALGYIAERLSKEKFDPADLEKRATAHFESWVKDMVRDVDKRGEIPYTQPGESGPLTQDTSGGNLYSDPLMIQSAKTAAKVIKRDAKVVKDKVESVGKVLVKSLGRGAAKLMGLRPEFVKGVGERLVAKNPTEGIYLMDNVLSTARQEQTKLINKFEEPYDRVNAKYKFTEEEIKRASAYADDRTDYGASPIKLTDREQALVNAFDESKLISFGEIVTDGPLINGRDIKHNADYAMTSIMDRDVRRILTGNKAGDISKIEDDYIAWHKAKAGSTTRQEALDDLNTLLGKYSGGSGGSVKPTFAAVRRAEGIGLPRSMREARLDTRLAYYNLRAAADLAYYRTVQKDPIAARIFGEKDTGRGSEHNIGELTTDKDLYTDTRYGVDPVRNLTGMDELEIFRREFSFDRQLTQDWAEKWSTVANSMRLGPKSAMRDVLSSIGPLSGYLKRDESGLVADAITRVFNGSSSGIRAGAVSSKRTGDFFSKGEFRDLAMKFADMARKIQGRDAAERFVRKGLYEIGTSIATSRLNNGDYKFIEQFAGRKWRDLSKSDLIERVGTRFMEQVQGSYSAEYLPAGLTRSQQSWAKAVFSLSRWSIERANRLQADVIKPMVEDGNIKPLIKQALGYMAVAAPTIQAIESLLTDKKPREQTWAEYFKLLNDDGTPSKVKIKELGYILASKAALTGMGGMFGYIANTGKQITYGERLFLPESPAISMGVDTTRKLIDYFGAYSGMDLLLKFWEVPAAIIADEFQGARMMNTAVDGAPDRGNREEAMFNRATGRYNAGIANFNEANRFNPEKKIREAGSVDEVRQAIPDVTKYYANRYQQSPGRTRNINRKEGFYEFLSTVQGREAAVKRYQEDEKQNALNEVRGEGLKEAWLRAERIKQSK